MADYLTNGSYKIQIPLKRLAPGLYQFGTKKIITKVVNEKLMVRVGGGMMTIDEYIEVYGEKERKKLMEKEYEEMNSVTSLNAMPSMMRSLKINKNRVATLKSLASAKKGSVRSGTSET